MKLFVSPHCDDETLFGAFTILREQPYVMIVYDGYVQQNRGLSVTPMERRQESIAALNILGIPMNKILFCALDDSKEYTEREIGERLITGCLIADFQPEEIFMPAHELRGHRHHNLVARAGLLEILPKITRYMTYTDHGKSVSNKPVIVENPLWIARKLLALACYTSQMSLDPRMGCWPHFLRSQEEFYA